MSEPKNPEDLKIFFNKPRKVIITTHVRPDGDAIGSSLALYHYLQKKGHDALVVLPTPYAAFYSWYPGISNTVIYEHHKEKVKKFVKDSEILFVVDFNEIKRNGELGTLLEDYDKPRVLIDHHTDPEIGFDYEFWTTSYSAAAEGVFDFIKMMDETILDDYKIASCLYGAIISDNGSFRHQAVSAETHLKTARLFKSGFNHNEIHSLVYDNFSENRLRLWGYCLNEKMVILPDHHAAYISLSLQEFKDFKAKHGYTEGLVNFLLAIPSINIAALITEKEDMIKLSFRSKNAFPVNEFARKYFNGGGHVNAAGGEVYKMKLEEVLDYFKEKLTEYFH